MSEQFADSIDVCPQIQHHNGKRVPSTMERNFLVDTCPQNPILNSLVGTVRRIEVLEHEVVRLATLAHKLKSLWCDVEIFLSLCFLLSEDDTGKFPLLMNIAPT